MLEILKIKKFALIQEAEINFKEGLNIISGETGAGKSILLEAIGLILGGRAKQDLIQKNEEEAQVDGFFDISKLQFIKDRLKKFELPFLNNELHIKRWVQLSGKSKIFINGEMVSLNVLQDVCEGLIDLCGQHEHQSLLKTPYQLELVDVYAGLTQKALHFYHQFLEFNKLLEEQKKLLEITNDQKMDFIKFQIDELTSAQLSAGEDILLLEKKKLFQNSKLRFENAAAVLKILSESESEHTSESLLNLFQKIISKLEVLVELDPKIKMVYEKSIQLKIDLEDLDQNIQAYLKDIEFNDEESTLLQERLALIASFRRKYGNTVEEMLSKLNSLKEEYFEFENKEHCLNEIEKKIKLKKIELEKINVELSEKRKNASRVFSKTVTDELKDLNMVGSHFEVEWEEKLSIEDWSMQSGSLRIQFIIQTNKGDKKLPLSKIASGGELSRVMLGIRRVMSHKGSIGVYLFDEIDSGMGGKTAFQVGKKLKSVSEGNQVICITHLPQVASFSDHHIKVEKNIIKNQTQTIVKELNKKEKIEELARMLGGPKLTPSSLKNAKEMILYSQQ